MGDVLQKFLAAPETLIDALDTASYIHRACCCASMETISAVAYEFVDYAFVVYAEVIRRIFGISGGFARHEAFRRLFDELGIDYDYEDRSDVPKEDNPYADLYCFDDELEEDECFTDWASCVLTVEGSFRLDLSKMFRAAGEHDLLETEWPISYHALAIDADKRVTKARITIAKSPLEEYGGYDADPYDDDEVLNCLGALVDWGYLREIAILVNEEGRCA